MQTDLLKPNWVRYEKLGILKKLLGDFVPEQFQDREAIEGYIAEEQSKCLGAFWEMTMTMAQNGNTPVPHKRGRPKKLV